MNMMKLRDVDEVNVVIGVLENFFKVLRVGIVIFVCLGLEVIFIDWRFENYVV